MKSITLDFLTSDMHFFHQNILKWRAFDGDVQELAAEMRRIWNETIGPDDKVGILGDALMGPRLEGLPVLGTLNGEKFLWSGNHDHSWRGNRKRITTERNWPELYGEYVTHMEDGLCEIAGLPSPVRVSHFPYWGDHVEEDRYMSYRPEFRNEWLLHGHVHDLWAINGPMINVGMDAWGKPLHVLEIAEIMSNPYTFKKAPKPNPLSNRVVEEA